MIFYHITTPEEWAKFEGKDFYAAKSLDTEGFIHASFAEQLEETLRIHYKNVPQVYILTIEAGLLSAELKLESSRSGAVFPHIYGVLNKSAILDREIRDLF
jgi:uncharacterized protein (DUF952 family)